MLTEWSALLADHLRHRIAVSAWYVLRDDEAGEARLIDIVDAFVMGAKYAISVGAAAATVGIIVGIVTLTGVGFKLSAIITGTRRAISRGCSCDVVPATCSTSRR